MSRSILHLSPPISTTQFPKTSVAPSVLFAKPLGAPRMSFPAAVLKLKRGATVRCMANPIRVKRVAQQILREISTMLVTDKVVKQAVLPESRFGADLYLSSLTTVSDVEVSNDLQNVKVYISVFGDERGKKVALDGLRAKTGYVRYQLGKRMRLRRVPEIRFIYDDSQERGNRVIEILDRLKREREEAGLYDDDEEWSDDEGEEDEDEDDEEEEEDEEDDDEEEYDEDDEDEEEYDDEDKDDEEDDKDGVIYVD